MGEISQPIGQHQRVQKENDMAFIKAMYNGNDVLLNTDYIVDIWNYDELYAEVYLLDDMRSAYKVPKVELDRFLKGE